MLATSASVRKRPWQPRQLKGCVTCRIRRVKCDETKPHCLRCVSTARKCDGYEGPSKVDSGSASSPATTVSGHSVEHTVRLEATTPIRTKEMAATMIGEHLNLLHANLLSDLHMACFWSVSLCWQVISDSLEYSFSDDDKANLRDSYAVLGMWWDNIETEKLKRCEEIVSGVQIVILDLLTSIGRLMLRVIPMIKDKCPEEFQTFEGGKRRLVLMIEESLYVLQPEDLPEELLQIMSTSDDSEGSDDDEAGTRINDRPTTSTTHISMLIQRIRKHARILMDLTPAIEQILTSTKSIKAPDDTPSSTAIEVEVSSGASYLGPMSAR